MKIILILVLSCAFFCNACGQSANSTKKETNNNSDQDTEQASVSYNSYTGILTNPGRGFYQPTEIWSSDPSPLTKDFLFDIRKNEKKTLIYRNFYLDKFYDQPISSSFLNIIRQDFDVLRQAGFKVVVRFAYTNKLSEDQEPPYNDSPPKEMVLQHIDQLAPIIKQNSDVILTLQNGFWGVWGENFYSDVFGCACNGLTARNWQDRKQITDKLLSVLPSDRYLSVRSPSLKAHMYDIDIPEDSLTAFTAYENTPSARIGYHNDCFLANARDNTFSNTSTDKPFWETESKYTIMGGETCSDNATYTRCPNALKDLKNAHWTYLNDDYHPDVLERWKNENCYREIRKRLGYRLSLLTGTFDKSVKAGSDFHYRIKIKNSGFASPVNPRNVFFVFKSGNQTFKLPIDSDPRTWYGGTTTQLEDSITVPKKITEGTYHLYLFLPDKAKSLNDDPKYAIHMANKDIWDYAQGYNDLGANVGVNSSN